MINVFRKPVKRVAGVVFGKGVRIGGKLPEQRFLKCKYCEQLSMKTGRCNLCGCYADEKVHWSGEVCPKGKW